MRKAILTLVVLVVAVVVFVLMRSATPTLDLPASVTMVGQATPISFHVHDPRGLRSAVAFLEQSGTRFPVWEMKQPSKTADSTFNFTAGVQSTPQLKSGNATLILQATSNDLLHKSAHIERTVNVVTQPPSVSVDAEQHYLYLGMADLVSFNVSGTATAAGVRVGDQTFRAWPMPGGKSGLFSLFAFAWNMPPNTAPVVYATNGPGSEATGSMVFQFPKKEQPHYTTHDLQISDAFMQKVVNELDPKGSGDMVARFVKINNEMRKANNKTLSDLQLKTADHFLWSQPFARQSHSQAEASFADVRNYIYQGKKIDQQVHLGYDQAATQHVGVEASNDGRIVYAAPLGIYGNCIVVDHGYGLQTIYGHLSEIHVHEGDTVKRGEVMGLSGQTGMAGGDHIHFAMQLDGVQIDPKEWWDPHWIQDHIARRVDLPGFQRGNKSGAARRSQTRQPPDGQTQARKISMTPSYDYPSIAKMIDHSLLNPTLTTPELEDGCNLAMRYDVASVCILPYALARCAEMLAGTTVHSSTTVGFPHGGHTTAVKLAEIRQALADGGQELDAVINISKARSGDWQYVRDELAALTEAVHAGGAKIKVIFENAYLDDEAKIRLCGICAEIGADWVKTSTGYAAAGATMADLELMRKHSPPRVQVKAAGGIRDLDALLAVRAIGVSRVGATRTQSMLEDCRQRLGLDPIQSL